MALILVFFGFNLLQAEHVNNTIKNNDSQIQSLKIQIKQINDKISSNKSIWLKKYTNFAIYNQIIADIEKIKKELKNLKNHKSADNSKINTLNHKLETLERQEELLQEYKTNPFKELIEKPQITNIPNISNPIAIIGGISFIKNLENQKSILKKNQKNLESIIKDLDKKYFLLQELWEFDKSKEILDQIRQNQSKKLELQSAQNILNTTIDIYSKDSDEVVARLKLQIKNQIFKLIYIGLTVIFTIALALALKVFVRRYIHDNERAYTASKIINFFNISIIILILLFAYLENVTYLVAFLGFASAGLAIAMKDLFMSVLGWFVIVLGGSVHVGDRIRVSKDGSVYVGDVLDISMLRITMHEDVTLTTYLENRRAGRIIFIPNNYIFTTMFANYTHGGMKTVWDGVDFTITFDSNYKKALSIASDVATKYSRGYTEITRKQLNKMRDKYSLRNNNIEPKTFSIIESNGIRISVWYQTNAYATLTIRSTISGEIIEKILKEPDIFIAYTTTKLIKDGTDGFGNKTVKTGSIEEEKD
ncbi:mechanosensitive ion channel [Helicobacter sp. faydin-H76]|uniref:Mechanosensitive ion channel n=1 Tax=Helicobacter cappadocius TaxID=3063998 RepID=A0AA90SS59_9HELI|nr:MULTISPECIES: mechanosensitive ion channel domain-containing protein [unclassified Helicobacter]MDO7252711.1 mechanosensitive ion channel [Helicobacter sp. faydin-H75]MDP2538579.1 mechanosensitive ion channel [Helicobacter sp. faydin-H76]